MEVPESSVDVGSFQVTGVSVVPKGTVTVMSDGKVVTTGGVLSAVQKNIKIHIPNESLSLKPLWSHLGPTLCSCLAEITNQPNSMYSA